MFDPSPLPVAVRPSVAALPRTASGGPAARLVFSALVVASVSLLATPAAGQTAWYVDDDNCPGPGSGSEQDPFCLIQDGIDAADLGDEVVVVPGTYVENIDFLGKAITVRSTNPTDPRVVANTIIDGGGSGSVVTCASGEGPDTVLEGLTITGGSADFGGGMYNDGASPTVTACTFRDNGAVMGGGGMVSFNGSPAVTTCTVKWNWAGYGGGMIISSGSPTVTKCTFTDNLGFEEAGGMGIYSASPTVTHCTFNGNIAYSLGGGMDIGASSPTVYNCTFDGNTGCWGGGVYIHNNSTPTVTNCTFNENWADRGRAFASDGLGQPPSDLLLTNCILWNGGDEIWNPDGSTITINYSDVQGGFAGIGNIDADPLFVDPDNGDLRLQPGSPCIDAADYDAYTGVGGGPFDPNDDPRTVDDPATPNTGTGSLTYLDMGALEFQNPGCDLGCDLGTQYSMHPGP